MIRKSLRLIWLTVLLSSIAVPFAFELQADAGETVPEGVLRGELIVEIRPGASIDAVNGRNDTSTIQQMNGTNFYRLRIPTGQSDARYHSMLAADPDVLSVSRNRIVASPLSVFARRTVAFPDNFAEPGHSSAEYYSQKGLQDLLRLDKALARSQGKGVVIAVIDTGVDITHPGLATRIWRNPAGGNADNYPGDEMGWNFVERNGDPRDPAGDPRTSVAGHGTFIAGLIALVAPDALIMPVRAFSSDGSGDTFTVAEAIKFAADHGADIINLSFGCPSRVGVLHDAIADARARGIVMAAAVGNDNSETTQFPAAFTRVLGVGAIDLTSRKAPFSNFGRDVSVDAPGVDLISTYTGGQFAKWSGTSFAAPLVAAEAALILAHDRLSENTVDVIERTSIRIDELNPKFKGKLGSGLINPLGALKSLYFGATAKEFKDLYAELALNAGPIETSAQGSVDFSVSSLGQRLRLAASSLRPRASYTFVVDGVVVQSSAVCGNMGSLIIEIDSPVGLSSPLTGIRHVEVLDDQGRVVMDGTFGTASSGKAPAGELVEKEAWLDSDSGWAGGRAVAVVDGNGQTLIIEGDRLRPGAKYQLIADGITVAVAVAEYGYCRATLTTAGAGIPLPKSLWPATSIKHIEMRDATGRLIILKGYFKPLGDNIGQGN
jgi:subtilisin family serine protease